VTRAVAAVSQGLGSHSVRFHERVNDMPEKMTASPPAIVLGLGQNGMATARALGRLGIPVIGIDSNLKQPGARTRYCETKLCCKNINSEGPALLECLLELGQRLECKGVLFPSSDLSVAQISHYRERIAKYYHFRLPSREVMEMFLNKKVFYEFAVENGFEMPRTFFTDKADNITHIAREINYPCLIKPFMHTGGTWEEVFDTRLFIADSPSMLKALFDCVYPFHQEFVIQEYMPGSDSELYWGVTYLDAQGEPLGIWTGRKLRQYPRRFGTATFAESCHEPWVARQALNILQTMGHRGYGVVEFKRDRRDGRFKITEPTGARTWFPHSLVTRSGINLPYIMYRDLLGEKVEKETEFEEGVKWIHEERDVKTVFLYFRPEGELSVWSWLGSLKGKRTYAYAAWDDPQPLFAAIGRVFSAGFRRLRRKLVEHDPERARHQGRMPAHLEELLLSADPTVGPGVRRVAID